MHVLVTGGAGFIGSHLVDHLLAQGCRVRVLDDCSSGSLDRLAHVRSRVQIIVADVRDPAALHLAALVSVVQSLAEPAETYDVNLLGTLRVLEAARLSGVRRVVLASTCAVYGNTERLPVRETDPPAPVSPYAASKLAAEEALQLYTRLYGLETVALRFFKCLWAASGSRLTLCGCGAALSGGVARRAPTDDLWRWPPDARFYLCRRYCRRPVGGRDAAGHQRRRVQCGSW